MRPADMTHPLASLSLRAVELLSSFQKSTARWRAARSAPSLARAAAERRPAGGAEVAAVVRHAGRNPLNVGNILVAEPHRVWFAGRSLLRGPLLRGRGRGRESEREPEECCKSEDRSQTTLCGANSHYRGSFGCLWFVAVLSSQFNSHGNSSGTSSAVSRPLRPRAMPAKVPASGSTWKARAVPIPCEVKPAAKPRAA